MTALFLGSLAHLEERERLLLVAAEQQDLAALQQQLAAGADVAAVDSRGLTALHAAALLYHEAAVAALLDAGADASASSACNDAGALTPLLCMLRNNPWGVWCQHPIQGPSPPAVHMRHACWERCQQAKRVAQQLVAAGAQVQVVDPLNHHLTPLHYAAEAGCPTLVAALLEAGADPGSSTPTGYTVLHAAVSSSAPPPPDAAGSRGGQQAASSSEPEPGVVQQVVTALGSSRAAEMVRALGAKDPDRPAQTPLHGAAVAGDQEMVEALVAAGADVDQLDADGYPALHWALGQEGGDLVPLLVTPGSIRQLSLLYGSTKTPLHEVAACGVEKIVMSSGQIRHVCDIRPAGLEAVEAVLKEMRKQGIDVLAKDQQQHTALYYVAVTGQADVMQLLLAHYPWHHMRQQYQHAGQQGCKQLVLDLFLDAAAYALVPPPRKKPLWAVLASNMAGGLGGEAVRTLWAALKPQVCNLEQSLGQELEHTDRAVQANIQAILRCDSVREAFRQCWESARSDLAAQPAEVTGRLEQLVSFWRKQAEVLEQRQQQQQQQQQQHGDAAEQGPTSSSTDNPAQVSPASRAAAGADATQPCSSGSSTPASVGPRSTAAVMAELEAAAASGNQQGVQAALAHLPDTVAGLSAAATAAGGAGHWRLCMGLLRELLMPGASDTSLRGWRVHQAVHSVLLSVERKLQQQQSTSAEDQQQQQQQQLQAMVQVCDALVDDWLAVRQQHVDELRAAVVPAAQAAADAAKAAADAAAAKAVAAAQVAAAEEAAKGAAVQAAAEAAAHGAAEAAVANKRRRM